MNMIIMTVRSDRRIKAGGRRPRPGASGRAGAHPAQRGDHQAAVACAPDQAAMLDRPLSNTLALSQASTTTRCCASDAWLDTQHTS